MRPVKHKSFQKKGVASLWLGKFQSELELDDYLNVSKQFEVDFGFEIDMQVGTVSYDMSPRLTEVSALINSFSSLGSSFTDSAIETAKVCGWTKATTAVVFYSFKYDPALIDLNRITRLTFIGSFPTSPRDSR